MAFAANLGIANPIIYIFGYRVLRLTIDGQPRLAIAHRSVSVETEMTVVHAVGVILVVKE